MIVPFSDLVAGRAGGVSSFRQSLIYGTSGNHHMKRGLRDIISLQSSNKIDEVYLYYYCTAGHDEHGHDQIGGPVIWVAVKDPLVGIEQLE